MDQHCCWDNPEFYGTEGLKSASGQESHLQLPWTCLVALVAFPSSAVSKLTSFRLPLQLDHWGLLETTRNEPFPWPAGFENWKLQLFVGNNILLEPNANCINWTWSQVLGCLSCAAEWTITLEAVSSKQLWRKQWAVCSRPCYSKAASSILQFRLLQLCHLGELSPTGYVVEEITRNQSKTKQHFGR